MKSTKLSKGQVTDPTVINDLLMAQISYNFQTGGARLPDRAQDRHQHRPGRVQICHCAFTQLQEYTQDTESGWATEAREVVVG